MMPRSHGTSDGYEIRLPGPPRRPWSDWFEGFTLTSEGDGTTTLTGAAIDQAALHGLLRRVADLGVTLISVHPIDSDRHNNPAGSPKS